MRNLTPDEEHHRLALNQLEPGAGDMLYGPTPPKTRYRGWTVIPGGRGFLASKTDGGIFYRISNRTVEELILSIDQIEGGYTAEEEMDALNRLLKDLDL